MPDLVTLDVQLKTGSDTALTQLMPLITAAGGAVQSTMISGLYEVEGPGPNMGQLATELSAEPDVQYASSMQISQDAAVPNDPDFTNGSQWDLNGAWGINAPAAWNTTTGSESVIVADVDTGINYNNPDLIDNVWLNQAEIPSSVRGSLTDINGDGLITFADLNSSINQGTGKIVDTNGDGVITATDVLAPTTSGGWASGSTQDGDSAHPDDLIGWDFVDGDNNPIDDNGHGTFTAGEIGAVGDNGTDGSGVAWNVQIMAVQAFGALGTGSDVACAEAIDYAVDHGARAINCSWGAQGVDPTIAAAIQYADQNGVIIVASAGNTSSNDTTTPFFPASYSAQFPNMISVAAIDSTGALANFSNYGVGTVQLAAPGVNVGSTLGNGFGAMSGTSMSAPLVTGTIALVEAAHPTWSMSQVIDAVLDHTTPDPALVGKVTTGGVLNAAAAVDNTAGPYVVSATPSGSLNSSSGLSSVQLTFDEEINPATFTPSQVALTGPGGVPISAVAVAAVAGSNDHEFNITFPSQAGSGTYTLKVNPSVEDWYGNEMNQNGNGVNGEASDGFVDTIYKTVPGSSQTFNITGVPTSVTAGTAETFTVTALNPNGSTDTSYLGTVQLTSSDPQASLPSSYSFTAADNGSHKFTVTLKTAGTQWIAATDTTTPAMTGAETAITVTGAAARSLVISGFSGTETAGTWSQVTVSALDAFGNVASGYSGTIAFADSAPGATLPATYTFSASAPATQTFGIQLTKAVSQTLTVTDTANPSLVASEPGISVQSAAAQAIVLVGYPTSVIAGVAHSVTVLAVDGYGNVVPSFTGTVTFSSSDPHAILPASYTFTAADAGSHAFSVNLVTAGPRTLKVVETTNPSFSATLSGIAVQAAAAQSFKVAGFPTADTAGTANSMTVTAYDAYGNVATGYVGTVHFGSSDGRAILPANYTFTAGDAGVHSFTGAILVAAGTQSITATDVANPSLSGSEANITVRGAAAKSLVVTGFPASDTAGTSVLITVEAVDSYGNPAMGYADTIHLSSSDGQAALPANFTFSATSPATRSVSVTLKSAGIQSITATDTANSAFSATESNIAVQAAALKGLIVIGFPTAGDVAGAVHSFTVVAVDAYGNTISGYAGTVHFTSSDGHASLPADYTFTAADAGVHTFTATLVTAGTQSLRATDTATSSLYGCETGIAVQAAAAASLKVTGFPTPDTAGTANSLKVTVYDAYGNVASGYTGTVKFASSDGRAAFPAGYTFSAADDGSHTFAGATLVTAGTQSITASDSVNSSITGCQSNITVRGAAAVSLVVAGLPSPDTAGTTSLVTVTAIDAYGNPAMGYAGTVHFTSSDGQAVLPANFTFSATSPATHSFWVTLKTAGSQSMTAADTANSAFTGTESIAVQAAALRSLEVIGFPTSDVAGVAHSFTVAAVDAYGNTISGYAGTVHFTSSDGHASLPADYTFTAADAGVHTFTATLVTAGTQSLRATDTATSSLYGCETGIAVQAAAAASLKVTGFPTPDTAGTAHSVSVTAYDAYGNVATNFVGTVSFSSSDSLALLPAPYTFTGADSGKFTFLVTLNTQGTQWLEVTYSTDGLSSSETGIVVK